MGSVVVAVAFTLVMAVGTAPTPLWPLYQAVDGMSTTTVSVLAGAVVVGAVVSFLLLGHLSDRFGRRRVLVPAVVASASAAAVMAAWPSEAGLLLGRVVTGLALGVVAPTATAYLVDLDGVGTGRRSPSARATTLATAANLGGLALGPVLTGVLAEWLPAPLVTPYSVLAALLLCAAGALLAAPEVGAVAAAGRARFALVAGATRAFAGAATAGFVSFAVTGIFAALGAIVVRGELAVRSVALWGLATGAVFAASAVAQLAAGRWTDRRLAVGGAVLLPIGEVLLVLALIHPQLAVYLLGCVVCGAACGLLFKAGLASSARLAVPASRAGVLAVHFSVAYLGMACGAVALALLERGLPVAAAYSTVAVALCALAAVGARTAIRRPLQLVGPGRAGTAR
jgi:MFS family permease